MTKPPKPKSQVEAFRKAARELGADESEATFDAALGKIARHTPKDDPMREAGSGGPTKQGNQKKAPRDRR